LPLVSKEVAGLILKVSTESNLKQVQLELAGKSPRIILDDLDLDEAIAIAALTSFCGNGQQFDAGSRPRLI
jgi:acyl-CoA reductase-like NAD-dependent aldehyde dehydrogenase